MVQITAPDGWTPADEVGQASPESNRGLGDSDGLSGEVGPPKEQLATGEPKAPDDVPAVRPLPAAERRPDGSGPLSVGDHPRGERPAAKNRTSAGAKPATPPTGAPSVPPIKKHRKTKRPPKAAAAGLAAAVVPAPPGTAAAAPPLSPPVPRDVGIGAPEPPPIAGQLVGQIPRFVSPAELLWRKWLLWSVVPLAGLVVLVGGWAMISRRGPAQPQPAVAETEADPAPEQAVPAEDPPPSGPDHFDLRWLPDGTVMLVDLRMSEGLVSAQGKLLADTIAGWWHPAVAAPLRGLRLNLQAIRRMRIVSTDLAAWPDRLVLLLELNEGHDATLLVARGEAVPIALGETVCRRLDEGWTHPVAILDERTILTGDEAVLSELAGRGEPRFRSDPIRNMLAAKPSAGSADARLLIDLSAARAAGWQLPVAALDVWPEARLPWNTLLGVPAGVDAVLQWPDRLQSGLILACESESAAEEVRGALDEFVPLARQAVAARHASLAEESTGEASAGAYAAFLGEASAALRSAQWRVDDRRVLVDIDWGTGPWALAAATLAAGSSLRADWLEAALAADTGRQQRIVTGLIDYQQAEGELPPGAVGGSLLPPETRLSWIAELLPYIGHADWHRSLRFGYAWNSPQNRSITRRPLDRFVNPALGPGRTEAGYPVTHYVGVAGVGPDAATLPADHPRAGVFGFGRRTRLEDIGDGTSNTIAILGVTKDVGAWAAGGHATVRPLTQRPYVNGPDGFGSGQVDGMLAGMADGSVRFISKDIDPEVVELLATINSGSQMTVAALGDGAKPKVPGPKPSADAEPRPPAADPDGTGKSPPLVVDADAAPEEPARQPLPAIDIAPRLDGAVPQITIADMPLGRAVALLAQLGGLPVTFDPEGLQSLGVSLRDPVSVNRGDVPLGSVLKDVLEQRGLDYTTEGGQVVITAPVSAQTELITRRYSVADLAGDDAALADLAKTAEALLSPESWQSEGGPGRIRGKDGVLEVEQTAMIHHALLVFLEKLRTARGLPIRSRFPREWFQLATRRSQAAAVLDEEITANFREPTPLVEVLGHLGGLAGADILLDRRALAAEGLSDTEPASVAVVDQPLSTTLDKLLRPLGLAWRALDARTVQVSTQAALDDTMELDFYPVAPLLDGLVTGQTLTEQICNRIAGPTWSDAGGPGVIRYDPKARCLIVRHNQAVQAAVERLLREQPKAPR